MSIIEKILERREQVKQLYFNQCWTPTEIATHLKICRRQVFRDLDSIKKHLVKYAAGDYEKTLIQWFGDVQTDYKARLKKLWHLCDTAGDPEDEVRALKEIRKTQSDYIEFMQKTGILHEAPKELHITVKDLLKKINDRDDRRIKVLTDNSPN